MTDLQLKAALQRYTTGLTVLERLPSSPAPEQVLEVLSARDALRYALENTPDPSPETLIAVVELDHRLKQCAKAIAQTIDLDEWQASLNPPAEAWWWFLEASENQGVWYRFDSAWTGLSIVCLTAAGSLIIDIAPRFLAGGPEIAGSLMVATQSVATILAARGALTEAGRRWSEKLLKGLRLPKFLWHEVQFGLALLVLLGSVGFRFSLPWIGEIYREQGIRKHNAGNLADAQDNYERAIALNPDDAEAQYNLGLLYEDLQNFNSARTQYQLAVQEGYSRAYNNLARLYILDGNNAAAVTLLMRGLQSIDDRQIKPFLHKNLGWARLEQGRFADAKAQLQLAIALTSEPAAHPHCLLAQVLEEQGQAAQAQPRWVDCVALGNGLNPEEDAWIGLARQRISGQEGCIAPANVMLAVKSKGTGYLPDRKLQLLAAREQCYPIEPPVETAQSRE